MMKSTPSISLSMTLVLLTVVARSYPFSIPDLLKSGDVTNISNKTVSHIKQIAGSLLDNCLHNVPRRLVGGVHGRSVLSVLDSVSLKYSCDEGYNLVGNSTIFCREGRWPTRLPRCQIDIVYCSNLLPPAPYFGSIRVNASEHQVTAVYECERGYKREGKSDVKCTGKRSSQLAPKDRPQCFLDYKESTKTCSFTASDIRCQYLTERNKPNKWTLELQKCKRLQKKYRFVTRNKPIFNIRLRTSNSSFDPLLQQFEELLSLPHKKLEAPPPFEKRKQTLRNRRCRKKARIWTPVLSLQPSLIVKRTTNPGVLIDSVLEVGLLRNSVAHFIKFGIEAPPHAVVYGLEVFGHCLPDPPGSLYPVYRLPPSPHSAVDRDFCIRLRDLVRCSHGIFDFFVRVRFLALFRPNIPPGAGEVRMTPKGIHSSVCEGFIQEDNSLRHG